MLPLIDGPFAVINADDYYGKTAFREIYRQLSEQGDNEKYQYAMVGCRTDCLYFENTLTENSLPCVPVRASLNLLGDHGR